MNAQLLQKFNSFLENVSDSAHDEASIESIRNWVRESGLTANETWESNSEYSFSSKDLSILSSIGESLLKIATSHFRNEDYKKTLELLSIALPVVSASGKVQKQIQLRNLEALAHMHLGDIRQTLNIYDRALTLARENSEIEEEARILFNMGDLLETNGSDECMSYLEQASSILKKNGNNAGLSFCCNSFASYYRSCGEPGKAREYSLEALKIVSDRVSPLDLASFLCNLALAEIDLDEYSDAQDHMEQALKLTDTCKDSSFRKGLISHLAWIHLNKGSAPKAEELLDSIQNTIEDCSAETRVKYWKARYGCFKQRNQMKLALEAFENSVKLNRDLLEEKRRRLIDMAIEERQLQREKREREFLAETNLQLVKTNRKLIDAAERVDTLTGLLPVCCNCRRVRNDEGYWKQLKEFMVDNSDVQFSECLCAECAGDVSSPAKEIRE